MIFNPNLAELTDVLLCEKFLSIQLWVSTKKMLIITMQKQAKSIVFDRTNIHHCISVSCMFGIELINEVKVLGDVELFTMIPVMSLILLLPSQQIQRPRAFLETAQ
jgi:hypothetical protein